MSLENYKFDAKEKELAMEIKNNPQSCLRCRAWQSGGDMSVCLFNCPDCKEKKAFSYIDNKITAFARNNYISYEEAWNIANNLLLEKQKHFKQQNKMYFDEDYFSGDLDKRYAEIKFKKIEDDPIKTNIIKKASNIFMYISFGMLLIFAIFVFVYCFNLMWL
jgi:hypothetical protein